jgi:putative transposase
VRRQFLVELVARDSAGGGARDLGELNRLFAAWVEGVYHRRVHTETDQPPIERFLAGSTPKLPTPAELREAFLWSEKRQVAKTALVSLHGNRYEVDPALVGRAVELIFDPFDLTVIEVRHQDRPMASPVRSSSAATSTRTPSPNPAGSGSSPSPAGSTTGGVPPGRAGPPADRLRRPASTRQARGARRRP